MTGGDGRVAAVVPVAGRGGEPGPGTPVALLELGGVPMLVLAVRALAQARLVDHVVVAAPPAEVDVVRSLLASHGVLASDGVPAQVCVVAGGATRHESVRCVLPTLPADVDVVLVHELAWAFLPSELVDAVVDAVRAGAAAVVPAVAVADTVKRVESGGSPGPGNVAGTLPRERLRAIQTPQGFRRAVLASAHAATAPTSTEAAMGNDDAGLLARRGHQVTIVPGSAEVLRITGSRDIVLAEAVLAAREAGRVR